MIYCTFLDFLFAGFEGCVSPRIGSLFSSASRSNSEIVPKIPVDSHIQHRINFLAIFRRRAFCRCAVGEYIQLPTLYFGIRAVFWRYMKTSTFENLDWPLAFFFKKSGDVLYYCVPSIHFCISFRWVYEKV